MEEEEYLTLNQLSSRFEAFTLMGLRWLRFNGDKNGFNDCVKKVGGHVLVSLPKFRKWINSHKAK